MQETRNLWPEEGDRRGCVRRQACSSSATCAGSFHGVPGLNGDDVEADSPQIRLQLGQLMAICPIKGIP